MKNNCFAMFIVLMLVAPFSFAENGFKKGVIEYIRVHESQHGAWAPPVFWFTLEGLSSFGSCKKWLGRVLLVAENEMFFSMVLAAQASNSEIAVRIEDGKVGAAGYCRAVYITSGKPPILQ